MAKQDGVRNAGQPALQVIVLGSGGGPQEHNVTALLVRSVRSGWARGSIIALDAGVHLSAITRILEETQPPGLGTEVPLPHVLKSGPFAGMEIQSISAEANAAYITKHLIDAYLITHPHLDHISGFVINTAGLSGARPKRIAGLPSTISAFKTHIFNNVIWPNLSDENNGAGLVTYTRLVEGGSPALGEGEGRGYLEVSDDLTVKVFSVSHGHCMEKHTHRGSTSSSRHGSTDGSSLASPRTPFITSNGTASGPSSLFKPAAARHPSIVEERESICVYDSSAYFIRDALSGREVLMFGDVEPDSISLSPRNFGVWQEAAPRIANGSLAAIFIECSFDDSQTDDRLFGHLTPRYIIQEMKTLAAEVEAVRHAPVKLEQTKKRKRDWDGTARRTNRALARSGGDDAPVSPKSSRPQRNANSVLAPIENGYASAHIAIPTAEIKVKDAEGNSVLPICASPKKSNALKGLKIVIIHVKETFNDAEPVRNTILNELLKHEKEAKLGCEFIVSNKGQSFMF